MKLNDSNDSIYLPATKLRNGIVVRMWIEANFSLNVRPLPRPHPYRPSPASRAPEAVGGAFQGGGPAFFAENLPDGSAAEDVAVTAGAGQLDIEAVPDEIGHGSDALATHAARHERSGNM